MTHAMSFAKEAMSKAMSVVCTNRLDGYYVGCVD